MERPRVLVVDDEPQIAEVIESYLEREGLIVEACGSIRDALAALERFAPDILVLDVTLPDGSGLDVLRVACAPEARVPTIMLTGRTDEADRVVGLELGADDYVTKPFSPRELAARVRSLLRRTSRDALRIASEKPTRRTRIGDLEIDFGFHEVRVNGGSASLTATEFKILTVLAEQPGEVFTRSHLLDRLGDDGEIYERTLDRHINNLRRKIEVDPRNPEYVVTVYGVGYKMRKIVK
ncbi:MAG: response regulator transcription factor [Candidatus Eremiobacteraeota bacterium]|nr:response regulator transcription factor [Candidatus Eremiobacteraeota bacterium]